MRSVDGTGTTVAPGEYTVDVMRHWPARVGEHGLRAGDIWFLLESPDSPSVRVRAAECKFLP